MIRCARALTILALCSAIGLHWVALQSVAWATMLIEKSKTTSLCYAVIQTFNGQHPCSLCRVVSKGKASEKKSDLEPNTAKIDLIAGSSTGAMDRAWNGVNYPDADFFALVTGRSPPVPPPRAA